MEGSIDSCRQLVALTLPGGKVKSVEHLMWISGLNRYLYLLPSTISISECYKVKVGNSTVASNQEAVQKMNISGSRPQLHVVCVRFII